MNKNEILTIVEDYVKKGSIQDLSAHDFYHIKRVKDTALLINQEEKQDAFVITMIALLHDVYDHKFYPDLNIEQALFQLLEKLKVKAFIENETAKEICYNAANISFKNGKNNATLSMNGKIVQDADRLDAIGAIAIARTFAYGGSKNRLIYDPENQGLDTISHFYEKLLKLKDLMNTEVGKKIALKRHEFMKKNLEQFFAEWNIEDLHGEKI
ncbi:similar to metal dependent phosphohydrolase [Alteracholeplasma palmae J233]|uniref:Similar to metal dependent phosphohydrolase n=1 Tax=Alteracholeplasma palmae (strain ATCC 49389 / J233) TaxID=1318466 RepID=U4KKT3_ALTPJ|nr:HD domain-containing protein [Alteracholeplasma palmae]CCV64292.1 similar to metal dependent phosphohydrolase [Alteracholeplasma palmae J233]